MIAIREISETDLVFFTQKETRKVAQLAENPRVSLTFWFELKQREVIIEGSAQPISLKETEHFWQDNPRFAQLRFAAYAPTSMQAISSKQILEDKKNSIEKEYSNTKLPLNPFYCGFRIIPSKFIFYTFRLDEMSDVFEYNFHDNQWSKQMLSP